MLSEMKALFHSLHYFSLPFCAFLYFLIASFSHADKQADSSLLEKSRLF